MKKNYKERGFTVIELMVVVSIIGVLSAITLATLSTARDRGEKSATVQQVQEYITAIELTYNIGSTSISKTKAQYPWQGTSGLVSGQRRCLYESLGSGNGCSYNGANLPLYPELRPIDQMITIKPISPPVVDGDGHLFDSVYYFTNGDDFWLEYPLEGELATPQECGLPKTTITNSGPPNFTGVTICRYSSE